MNLRQLINLSKINKELKKNLDPIIKKRKQELFIKNYTLLFDQLDKRIYQIDTNTLKYIYNTYGNESLFFNFLFDFLKIRVKNQYQFNILMNKLSQLFKNTNDNDFYKLFKKFKKKKKIIDLYNSLHPL